MFYFIRIFILLVKFIFRLSNIIIILIKLEIFEKKKKKIYNHFIRKKKIVLNYIIFLFTNS
jgi:hypothetical protein